MSIDPSLLPLIRAGGGEPKTWEAPQSFFQTHWGFLAKNLPALPKHTTEYKFECYLRTGAVAGFFGEAGTAFGVVAGSSPGIGGCASGTFSDKSIGAAGFG